MDAKEHAVAVVGVGAILPDAPNAAAFWQNILNKRYSISEVPPERWRPDFYYDPDPKSPDKTYSKIGGWVRGFEFDWRRFRMPPKVAGAMDEGQQWAVTIAADALADYGYPDRPLDTERTAVVLGTAMGGELHYITQNRIVFPEFADALAQVSDFQQLPAGVRQAIMAGWHQRIDETIPAITEDSMPGELPNIVSGRVANVLNLRGPNFITDAACASSFAAVQAAVEMLSEHQVDAVIAGGVDRNMGAASFVKFCKIGALSATGSRPFGEGADGFVMGEGAAAFILKRLADAEQAGDRIYAVIRGVGGASDGKGKGITAPNPIGQQLSIQRAWEHAGLDPATATLIEAHGTSTRVGDVVEVESLANVFNGAPRNSIGLGSVKSNIGHLKAGAGAAGLLKAVLATHHKIYPPTLNAGRPNPNIDFRETPFFLIHEPRPWEKSNGDPRRCGVSAYGFGGTNFHIVLEEPVPGMLTRPARQFQGVSVNDRSTGEAQAGATAVSGEKKPRPVRGILALGAETPVKLKEHLDETIARAEAGWVPPLELPSEKVLKARERLIIDFGDGPELSEQLRRAQRAMGFDTVQAWKAVEAQGIFRGSGPAKGKIAYLFPGQGSQYPNMGRKLVEVSPSVAEVFADADRVMMPILGRPLTDYIFVDENEPAAMMRAQFDLMQTEITQPAMLTLDMALFRLLADYGFQPDMVMGHSLGEYAALIAAGVMPFAEALEAAAARGSEMSKVSMEDNGKMAAVLAPFEVVEEILSRVNGYVVPANINSHSQSVIGGASAAVEEAVRLFEEQEYKAMLLPVSHAFHTSIVAPASKPLRQVLDRLHIAPPRLPLVANVTGDLYPTDVEAIKDLLQTQVAAPVQWVKGLHTLYDAGVRMFVEVGPKRALRGFANDVFKDKDDVQALLTNHPKNGELASFNQALCGLYAAGFGLAAEPEIATLRTGEHNRMDNRPAAEEAAVARRAEMTATRVSESPISVEELGQALSRALQQAAGQFAPVPATSTTAYDRNATPLGSVVISGTGLGLPGAEKSIMDPDNAIRILRGEQFVDLIPARFRQRMVDKHIVRLVKSSDGSGSFATIDNASDVIKLAGRPGSFDLHEEYGVPEELIEALDITTQLAMAAGLDALREAGIPLVQTYKKTTTGKYLPQSWVLPEALRDETGVIFASAFPGGDRFADEFRRYYDFRNRQEQLEALEDLRRYTADEATLAEIGRRITMLREQLEAEPYFFDRRFLFRILSMGHSQFAQFIGARGPNTQVNAACASTAQAIAIAEDWIRSGRCRRVIVIGADNVTGDNLLEWVGAGFLAVGAATTQDKVEEAALPFDRRRHGTIMGMGACALVVESEDALRERGMRGIVELLSSETNNSAFHGTRLDVQHIALVMNNLVTAAERRFGIHRHAIAPQTVFVSHETYTPARGGSASAEVVALREVFGESANEIIVANTKGFTGHPMGVGIEDVIAVKILEHGIVPPVPNFKEIDPDLGPLNFSRGGRYPVHYSIHLAAGFGSQIALTLLRRIPGSLDRIDSPPQYNRWLSDISGYDWAETEVVNRVLRIKANGQSARQPAASRWQFGTGPTVRALVGAGERPAVMPARINLHGMEMPPAVKETNGRVVASPSVTTPPSAPVAPAPTPAPVPPFVETRPAAVVAAPATEAPVAPVQRDMPPPEAAPQPPAAPFMEAAGDPVAAQVLALVAAQTGYPEDMLDLDLDLEADLGIDTVKQAETFAAIREAFDIPRRDDLSLSDYNTMEKVIGFVREMRPDLAAKPVPVAIAKPTPVVMVTPIAGDGDATAVQPGRDPVAVQVLAIVAEQTGYPEDMLDMDLDLEADLGIDTVKQAETFVAIREAFDIPRRDDLSLSDYNTLEKVVGFVHEMRPDLAATPAAAVTLPPAPALVTVPAAKEIVPQPDGDPVAVQVLAIVAEQTGYPPDMLELDLDLEADLGIDTVKQAETFVAIRSAFDIPRRDDLSLSEYNTLEKVIGFVREMRPDLVAIPPAAAVPEPAVSRTNGASAAQPDSKVEGDPVAGQVLAIVAAQTGYPQDMLELDLDLEADLGIDTVKQAETFVAIRSAFDIPRRDDLSLSEYNTLQKVIGFVHEMRPDLHGGQPLVFAPTAAPTTEPEAVMPRAPRAVDLEMADRMPRRVPAPAPRPAIELCKPTGVEIDANSRVVVMHDQGGVGKALVSRLEKLGATVLAIDGAPPAESLIAQVKLWLEEGPIQGIYWLPALDVEPEIMALDLEGWREHNRLRVKNLAVVMRELYDVVQGAGAFLVSATRLGGLHGYGPEGATAPLGGAVAGFTKAYKRERPDVLVKVVDFAPGRKTAALAEQLIAETLFDPGIVEVGYPDNGRYTVTLVEQPAADGAPGLTLNADTIFVVTGAAGGITSAIVNDLAAASGGVFYLLDLVPEPDPHDEQIRLFRSDKEALKEQFIAAARAKGERPTPVLIEKQMMAVERGEAALRAIEGVQAAGGVPIYRSVNLLDGEALAAVVGEIRERYGRINVLVHAGGIEISRSLDDKLQSQFDLVFDIKADGFFSLLRAAGEMPIGATVAFSSVAGRFGNSGQTDYSATNDLLCKLTSSLRRWRPQTRGIVIDWTAWSGIGMATRGSIPKIMEMAGIEMLPPEVGIPTVRRELAAGGFSGEVVVGGALGVLTAEWDETGGLDLGKANAWLAENRRLMVGEIVAAHVYGGLQARTVLDPREQAFLHDHALEGTPVLPGVMGTEAFAEMATLLAPGYQVRAVRDERLMSLFKFYRHEPQTLRLSSRLYINRDGELVADCELRSVRDLAKPGLPPKEQVHFTAQVDLMPGALTAPEPIQLPATSEDEGLIGADAIYERYFHGPAYKVLDWAYVSGDAALGLMANGLPPHTSPADAVELMAPRLIELCFQTVGVWEMRSKQVMALPFYVGSVTAYAPPASAESGKRYAIVEAVNGGESFNAWVADEAGNVFVALRDYRTVQLPGNAEL